MKFGLITCLLTMLLVSCSYKKVEFEKGSNHVNKVKAGEKFFISLPEDHKTSKYYWGVSHDYDKKAISYIQSIFHGKTVEFNFEAIAKGKTEINFSLNGYQDVKETKTFVVEVE